MNVALRKIHFRFAKNGVGMRKQTRVIERKKKEGKN